ncbi:unnamed protein product [Echinostoma caproni]|uniref:DUF3402 domain-containing protein n=1 Tax=Echinostoma caproni TaxID=27848 RepID=A0A182ZZ78_9TREM|nr:unnamed protein product [Echinostoma caproni]
MSSAAKQLFEGVVNGQKLSNEEFEAQDKLIWKYLQNYNDNHTTLSKEGCRSKISEEPLIIIRLLIKVIKELCMTRSGQMLVHQSGLLEVLLQLLHETDRMILHFVLIALIALTKRMTLCILRHMLQMKHIRCHLPAASDYIPSLLSLIIQPISSSEVESRIIVFQTPGNLETNPSDTEILNKYKNKNARDFYQLAERICVRSLRTVFGLSPAAVYAASCVSQLATLPDLALQMRTHGAVPILLSSLSLEAKFPGIPYHT